MDAEIAAWVSSGATTLISLMVTDSWNRAKEAAARMMARNEEPGSVEAVCADLDESRDRLLEALGAGNEASYTEASADLASEWRSRLRRAIERDPATAEQLEHFIAEFDSENAAQSSAQRINFSTTASDNVKIFQQGQGTQYNR